MGEMVVGVLSWVGMSIWSSRQRQMEVFPAFRGACARFPHSTTTLLSGSVFLQFFVRGMDFLEEAHA
jgi:hypothetical protein